MRQYSVWSGFLKKNFSSESQELRGVPTRNSSLQKFPKGISKAQRLLHLKGNAFRGSLGRVYEELQGT